MLGLLTKVFKAEEEEKVVRMDDYKEKKEEFPEVQLRTVSRKKKVRFGYDSEEEYQAACKEERRKREERQELKDLCSYFG